MIHALPATAHRANGNQRTLLPAVLLLLAQLFTQAHALEHLEHRHDEGTGGEVCEICILGVGLDSGATGIAAAAPRTRYDSPEHPSPAYRFVAAQPFRAFAVRAPPVTSSIATTP